jgi:hypothetical protein
VIGADSTKYEIKGRRPTPANPSRQPSDLRGLTNHHFDYLVGVFFAPDLRVLRMRHSDIHCGADGQTPNARQRFDPSSTR